MVELRERLATLRARTDIIDSAESLTQARRAADNAVIRRDEAALRDQAAHESSAKAHNRAALTYEELATTVSPALQAEYTDRARTHREAARHTMGEEPSG